MANPVDPLLDALDRAGCNPRPVGHDKWTAFCPVHEGDGRRHKPSLSISIGQSGNALVYCFAGCSFERIISSLGLKESELWPDDTHRHPAKNNGNQPAPQSGRKSFPTVSAALEALRQKYGEESNTRTYHDANGKQVGVVVRWDRQSGKDIRPISRLDDQWQFAAMPVPRPLYRLPELLAADPSRPVFVVEGEKCADALVQAGLIATTSSGGANAAHKTDWTPLKGRRVVICPDFDEPGDQYANTVARLCRKAGAIEVKILRLNEYAPQLPSGRDVADIIEAEDWCGIEELSDTATPKDFGDWLLQQAEETPAEKERQANTTQTFTVPAVEPWNEPVNLGDVLEEARIAILRHMYITEEATIAAALWAAATYVYDRFDIFPLLTIQSPTKRCGKTTLLTILKDLVEKPLPAANISAAAIYRVIELYRPTLLIDEADTWLVANEEARGIINAGHTRDTAFVVRLHPKTHQPEKFSCWSPKVFAAIGRLQGTIEDRAIRLQLDRKPPTVKLERLTPRAKDAIANIGRRFARWARDYGATIDPNGDPPIPESLNDRAADNWRPLLILADMAGGKWPEAARHAAINLSGGEDIDTAEPGIRLLASIAELLPRWEDREIIASGELLEALHSLDEWAHYGRSGRPITPKTVANLLNPFGIKPLRQREGKDVIRGYSASALKDAIQRYVPPGVQSVTSVTK